MKNWFGLQWEWLKGFFASDTVPGSPSHKNLIGLSLVCVFCVAFLKKVAGAEDVPDVPVGWQLVLLGILGIRSAQAVLEKKFEKGDKDA